LATGENFRNGTGQSFRNSQLARELKGRERKTIAEYASTKATTAGEFFVRDLIELATKLGQ
jgi:hypothetical protein